MNSSIENAVVNGKFFFRLMFVLLLVGNAGSALALQTVTLQLKWKHQFQFAGYYAAIEHGYYQAAGFDVKLLEATEGEDPVESVLQGRADYGVGTSDLILLRRKGEPVVVLAVIFQHSPLALLARKDSGIRNIHDLADRPLMFEANSAELLAYLAREGIDSERLNRIHHSFNIDDLLSSRVAAMSVYVTDEPFLIQQQIDYLLFEPALGGVDFYGDNLFTTQQVLDENPERVKAFREASLKGWQYAMAHPEELVQLIHSKYSKRHSIEHLRFEAAEMQRLLRVDLVDIGYMSSGRWQHIADVYNSLGQLSDEFSLQGFLYDPAPPGDFEKWAGWIWGAIALSALSVILILVFFRLNRRLANSEAWLQMMFDQAPTALVQIDDQGYVQGWSQQAEQMFGWRKDEVIGRRVFDFMVPEDEQLSVAGVMEEILGKHIVNSHENWNLTKSGRRVLCHWRNVELPKTSYRAATVVAMATDITERRQLEIRLQELAHSDPLTGISNRALFYEQFGRALKLAVRRQGKLALMFIDLDDFKNVNDEFGHESGDNVLQVTVARIRGSIRETDVLARHGGDEFVVLLEDCRDAAAVEKMAEKIVRVLARPIPLPSGGVAQIGASIGISLYPGDGQDTDSLTRAADQAMYQVKRKGKRGYSFADGKK